MLLTAILKEVSRRTYDPIDAATTSVYTTKQTSSSVISGLIDYIEIVATTNDIEDPNAKTFLLCYNKKTSSYNAVFDHGTYLVKSFTKNDNEYILKLLDSPIDV